MESPVKSEGSISAEMKEQMKDCLETLSTELQCSVCLSVLRDPISLPCNHTFCSQCLSEVFAHSIKETAPACPECRHNFSRRTVIEDPTICNMVRYFRVLRGLSECALGIEPLSQQNDFFMSQDTPSPRKPRARGVETGSDGLDDSDSAGDIIKTTSGKGRKRSKDGRKRKSRNRERMYGMGAGITMGWAKLRLKRRHQSKTNSKRNPSSRPISNLAKGRKSISAGKTEEQSESREGERERKRRRKSLTPQIIMRLPDDDRACMSCCLPCVCRDDEHDESVVSPRISMQCFVCGVRVHNHCYRTDDEQEQMLLLEHGAQLMWKCDSCETASASQSSSSSTSHQTTPLTTAVSSSFSSLSSSSSPASMQGLVSARPATIRQCAVCPNTEDRVFKATTDGRWVHAACALWHAALTFTKATNGRALVANISQLEGGARSVRCVFCSHADDTKRDFVGSCLQCSYRKCNVSYHVPCARRAGVVFQIREAGTSALQARANGGSNEQTGVGAFQNNGFALYTFCPKHQRQSWAPGVAGASTTEERVQGKKTIAFADCSRTSPSFEKSKKQALTTAAEIGEDGWIVLLGTLLNKAQQTLLEEFVALFNPKRDEKTGGGGAVRGKPRIQLATAFTERVTHLITPALVKQALVLKSRTMKYFMGLVSGKRVMSIDWIEECLTKRTLLPESAYLITGDSFALGASRRSLQSRLEFVSQLRRKLKDGGALPIGRDRETQATPAKKKEVWSRLFEGRHFAFSNNFSEDKHVRLKKDLTQLLLLGQGVVYDEIPCRETAAQATHPHVSEDQHMSSSDSSSSFSSSSFSSSSSSSSSSSTSTSTPAHLSSSSSRQLQPPAIQPLPHIIVLLPTLVVPPSFTRPGVLARFVNQTITPVYVTWVYHCLSHYCVAPMLNTHIPRLHPAVEEELRAHKKASREQRRRTGACSDDDSRSTSSSDSGGDENSASGSGSSFGSEGEESESRSRSTSGSESGSSCSSGSNSDG